MRWWRRWTVANRVALIVAAASVPVLGIALHGALRRDPLPAAEAAGPVEPLPVVPPRVAGRPELAISAAVARDPFRRDRRRPPGRYRPPGERVARPQARPVAGGPRIPALRLVGTASFEDGGGLAAISIPGGMLRVLRVGQTLDGLELIRVDRGSATLAGPDTTVVLRLPQRP